ncbi:hypothetical protein D5018_13435 [Parashewanella curva]|uniref:Uncharacterized protein n=1 Tax=Parashewanella curva TaxID=2338552 RepID=A0A3L8PYQ6_9GAMM|nr:outer membrane beta-barrel protein [Parashewanella curva]RLV59212.1 hypothetical protein D5018_13435 [Parashewanella curva]
MNRLSKISLAATCLSVSLTSLMASAETFNYNYAEVTGLFGKTEFNATNKNINQKPDLSTKGFGITVQYSPYEGLYLKGVADRLKIDDSKDYGMQSYAVDGNSTTLGALVGMYAPVTDNIDVLGAIGIANVKDDFTTSTRLMDPPTIDTKSDESRLRFYGEAGFKAGLGTWGELDLMYHRLNDENYFSATGNFEITDNWGLQTGYSYSRSGKNRERYGTWIVGVRYSF